MHIHLDPVIFFRFHLAVIATLSSAYVITQALGFLGHERLLGLTALFDLNSDLNIASFFSAAALLLAGILMVLISRTPHIRDSSMPRYWLMLGWIFIFLSLDESLAIHEHLGQQLLAGRNPTAGTWHYGWIFIYLPLVIVCALSFLPFLARLPTSTRNGLIVAGCLYVGGAVGLEITAGLIAQDPDGSKMWLYSLEVLVEESCEMLGVAVLIRTVLAYPGVSTKRRAESSIESVSSAKEFAPADQSPNVPPFAKAKIASFRTENR